MVFDRKLICQVNEESKTNHFSKYFRRDHDVFSAGDQCIASSEPPVPEVPSQCGKPRHLQFASIEHVEGVERDQALPVRMGNVDAALFHAAYIERLRIDELDDEHAAMGFR